LFLLAGTGTDKLIPLLQAEHTPYFGPFQDLTTLLEAVRNETEHALRSGSTAAQEIVVFSPGATSFGMFKNEFDRGLRFKEAVRQCWPTGHSPTP